MEQQERIIQKQYAWLVYIFNTTNNWISPIFVILCENQSHWHVAKDLFLVINFTLELSIVCLKIIVWISIWCWKSRLCSNSMFFMWSVVLAKFYIYMEMHFFDISSETFQCQLECATNEQILENNHIDLYKTAPLCLCTIWYANFAIIANP